VTQLLPSFFQEREEESSLSLKSGQRDSSPEEGCEANGVVTVLGVSSLHVCCGRSDPPVSAETAGAQGP